MTASRRELFRQVWIVATVWLRSGEPVGRKISIGADGIQDE